MPDSGPNESNRPKFPQYHPPLDQIERLEEFAYHFSAYYLPISTAVWATLFLVSSGSWTWIIAVLLSALTGAFAGVAFIGLYEPMKLTSSQTWKQYIQEKLWRDCPKGRVTLISAAGLLPASFLLIYFYSDGERAILLELCFEMLAMVLAVYFLPRYFKARKLKKGIRID